MKHYLLIYLKKEKERRKKVTMSGDANKSIGILKSKIDAIHSLRVEAPREANNSRVLSKTINNIAYLDFSSLVTQLKSSGSLKKLSFVPNSNTKGKVLCSLSDLLFVESMSWPADADFREYCAQTKGPARALRSNDRMKEATEDDDSATVNHVPLTEEEENEFFALNKKVADHNGFINSLVDEMNARNYGTQPKNEDDKTKKRMKVIPVNSNVFLLYDRILPGFKPPETLKRPSDKSEGGNAPAKKSRRK